MPFGWTGGQCGYYRARRNWESALLSTAAGVLPPDEWPAVVNKNSGISFLQRNTSF